MRTRLLLLAGQTIALGLMMAFLIVPASALFLHEYGAHALAYTYLSVAVAGVLVTSALSRAQRRTSLAVMATRVAIAYVVVVALAWVILTTTDGVWVTFPLLILFPLSIPVGFAMVGAQAGRLLDVRALKAHFPRVASGFSVGFATGGVGAALLVAPLGGPEHLLAVDLLMGAVMVGLVVATGRRFHAELGAMPEPQAEQTPQQHPDRRALLRNRLVLAIFGYQILSGAVTQLLDFTVWERAAARYPDPSDLARFQGVFSGVINVTSVAFGVLVAGWLLSRFGIGLGLLANPVAVLALLVVTSLVGVGAGIGAWAFFLMACGQQVADLTLTDGTTRASINASYQALLPAQRLPAQTMIEGSGIPLALGLVGVLVLVRNLLDVSILAIVLVTFVLTLVWTFAAVVAYREYGANLRTVLSTRDWDPVALRLDDDQSRAAVDALFATGDLRDTETAIEALLDAGSPDAQPQISLLLGSEDPERRRLALRFVAESANDDDSGAPEADPVLLVHLADDDPDVADLAARALAAGRSVVDQHAVRGALEVHAARAARALDLLELLERLDAPDECELLVDALRDEVALAGDRAVVLLGLAHDRQAVTAGVIGIASEVERDRNTAVEMLEVTVGRSTVHLLQATLTPGIDDATRLHLLGRHDGNQSQSLELVLRELVADDSGFWRDTWLRACALYALPAVLPGEARALATTYGDDPDPVVAETAQWVVTGAR